MYRHSNCKFLEVHIVLIIQLFQDLDNSAQNFYFNKSYSSSNSVPVHLYSSNPVLHVNDHYMALKFEQMAP